MTLRKHPETGIYEADIRDRTFGRLHLSLKTKKQAEASVRYGAVEALLREGHADLVDMLRRRKLNVEAVARCARERKPFETLRETTRWGTLADARERFLAHLKTVQKAEATQGNNAHYLESAVDFFGATTLIESITHERVEEYAEFLRTRPLKNDPKKTLMAWSRAQFLIAFSALFNWLRETEEKRAAREHRLPRRLVNPVDTEIIPKYEATKTRFLSEAEVEVVMAATPDAMRWPIAAGILAGLRIGELTNLRPPPLDVDAELTFLTVQRRDGVHAWAPKGGKPRDVPIDDRLRPILAHHLETYASRAYVTPSGFFADGLAPVDDTTVNRHLKMVIGNAGLIYGESDPMGVTYHTLRHTFASHLVMDGVDLKTISRLMGHSSTKQVEVTYGHLSPEHRRAAIARLGVRLQAGFPLEVTE